MFISQLNCSVLSAMRAPKTATPLSAHPVRGNICTAWRSCTARNFDQLLYTAHVSCCTQYLSQFLLLPSSVMIENCMGSGYIYELEEPRGSYKVWRVHSGSISPGRGAGSRHTAPISSAQ